MKNTKTNNQNKNKHIPVLPDAVLKFLDPKDGESYLDLTAGYGGHAKMILERTLYPQRATLVDRDQNAIATLREQFEGGGAQIIHKDFLGASQELLRTGKQFDLILADLGVSSPHLNQASRGFSLRLDGPLDMRMDQRQSLTAEAIINTTGHWDLMELIREYGEEPRAKKIAQMIVENRPITTTHELARIVARAYPGHSKIHPATRTFQALRIAVNSELDQLKAALPAWVDLLSPGGRIVVISFHSLEDRIVKQSFNDTSGNRYDARLKLLTRQPVTAGSNEIVFNPRARSAKLRAAVKK
jgi:16S rRNA (cytosine1402-N4)-methyltransferase